ncbi:MAG: oxygenase MpaB family protein [Vitreoscilla sp.]
MNSSNPLRAALAAASRPLQGRLARLVYPPGTQPADFLQPAGEAALLAADSVSWRVFANPVALLVGGVAAVLLELAEPRVRTGVWDHTTFRSAPLPRLQRTGYAAMLTVFGARSRTEAMIRGINAGHARIAGRTPAGVPYRADDVDLLTWVHATATFGFLQGYVLCVRPLDAARRDAFYAENQASARLYGVASPPGSEHALEALFERMRPLLEPSPIVGEFLAIMRAMPLLPGPLRPLQGLLLRAAVQALPADIRARLGLDGARWRLAPWQWRVVRTLGRAADHLGLPTLPAQLARRRLASRA